MDFFRNLFGFPNRQPNSFQRFIEPHEEDDYDEPNIRKFNVFTDPLEMHRYFEEQMDQVFRSFDFSNFGNFFHQIPAVERHFQEENFEEGPKNFRENFLNKEYVKPHYEHSGEKMDKDLDGKLNLGDLDSIIEGPRTKHSLNIYREQKSERKSYKGTFFNQSIQVKTIRKSDGSLETQKTVRDNQGNEHTTITQKLGDKEYTIIKKFHKDGKEEIQEIMTNMDEKDKVLFQNADQPEHRSFGPYFDNSMFNKFFK